MDNTTMDPDPFESTTLRVTFISEIIFFIRIQSKYAIVFYRTMRKTTIKTIFFQGRPTYRAH